MILFISLTTKAVEEDRSIPAFPLVRQLPSIVAAKVSIFFAQAKDCLRPPASKGKPNFSISRANLVLSPLVAKHSSEGVVRLTPRGSQEIILYRP